MCNKINFKKLQGPFVLWYSGECPQCLILNGPEEVIEHICSENGFLWTEFDTIESLLNVLDDPDNWNFTTNDEPFRFCFDCDEINRIHIIANAESRLN